MLNGAGSTESGMLHWLTSGVLAGHSSSKMLVYPTSWSELATDLDTLSSTQLLGFMRSCLLLWSVKFSEGMISVRSALSNEWKFLIKEHDGNCGVMSDVGGLHLFWAATRTDCVPVSFSACQELWILQLLSFVSLGAIQSGLSSCCCSLLSYFVVVVPVRSDDISLSLFVLLSLWCVFVWARRLQARANFFPQNLQGYGRSPTERKLT